MLLKCSVCGTVNKERINTRVSKTGNNKTTLLLKCSVCGTIKSRFNKQQEASGILSSLGLKIPLSKILLYGDDLFWM